ncbi:retrovirus-related pol polyprotein from transposon TNT 1-94 [Tanacetum coccineum]
MDETPPPPKTSPLEDDELVEEAIEVSKIKPIGNDLEDISLENNQIVNIKESKTHPLENVIGNLNQRTLRSQAQDKSNFFCFISTIEPKNINEALKDKNWVMAMQEELNQFKTNDVWELVPNPMDMTIIGTKWVYRNKLDENGVVTRNKASFINEEVYVAQPLGFIDFVKPNYVYRLKKALYGLKQALKAWYDRLKAFLIKHDYSMGMVDNTLFTKKKDSNLIIVQIYVDDIIFGSTCQEMCDDFAKIMHDEFEMSMMGELNFFLGLQIKQLDDGIFFNQSKYIKEMLKKFGLEDSKPIKTPMSTETKLTRDEEGESVDNTKYRGMIGSLLYLTASRPDIMFSVCLCARFQEDPKTSHLEAVKRIFRYIKGTTHLGLWYPKGSGIETIVYADSDHAGDYVDRKSTSGVCTFMGCCLTSWFSKKQTALAISTTEAEYVSAGKACQQALWMKQALVDYGVRLDDIPIMCDNKGAIDLTRLEPRHLALCRKLAVTHVVYGFHRHKASLLTSEETLELGARGVGMRKWRIHFPWHVTLTWKVVPSYGKAMKSILSTNVPFWLRWMDNSISTPQLMLVRMHVKCGIALEVLINYNQMAKVLPVVQKSGIQCYNCKDYGMYQGMKLGSVNAVQADWKVDTDAESEDQNLIAIICYMDRFKRVTPDPVDNSRPIFDDEPMHKVQNNNDNYNVFAMENEHPEQPESTQDDQDDTDDLDQERDLLASLIQKLKCEIDDSKNRNKFLESSNKALVDKLKGALCDQEQPSLMSTRKSGSDLSFTQKLREDKELDKVIALENKVKVLDDIVYKTGQYVQTMNMLNRNCKTSFAKPEFLKKAQSANPRL